MKPSGLMKSGSTTLRVDIRILATFLLLSILLFVFVKFASEVVEGDTLAFDRLLMAVLRSKSDPSLPIGPRWVRIAMLDITALGGVAVLTVLTTIVAGYFLVTRKIAAAGFLVAAVSGGALLGTELKAVFNRPRPDLFAHLVDVNSTSFPSGHAMNSAIVYLTLGALLARTHTEPAPRIYILSVAIALALVIGLSRVFLGVHWPSDVVAGWTVGAFWAALCSIVAHRLQQNGKIDKATHDGRSKEAD